jgi:outer membrane protein OmpA-like peptidoglycan-associated protein
LLRYARVVPIVTLLFVAGCGGHAKTAATPPPAAAVVTAVPSEAPSAGPSQAPTELASGATPTPEPTPTPDANLLSWKNGAIVRAYPAQAIEAGDVNDIAERGPSISGSPAPPYVFVYELPGPAAITAFTADVPNPGESEPPASVTFATSNSSAGNGFQNAGTITATAAGGEQRLPVSVTARWIRVTSDRKPFNSVGAIGTVAALPASVSPAGIYVEMNRNPYKDGAFDPTVIDNDPWYRRVVVAGNGMTATRCFDGHTGDAYPGTLDGRTWTFRNVDDPTKPNHAIVNEDASLIVGDDTGTPMYLLRSTKLPKFCEPALSGSGARHAIVLDSSGAASIYPVDDQPNAVTGYAYERINAGMLDPDALAGKDLAILNMLCDASAYLSKPQGDALLQWVAAGHKLLIVDSDGCSKSRYDFLPYPFTTSNPGAQGAAGDRLIIVENDALGTSDKSDTSHYFDPKTFINGGSNQLGDANIVTTQDSHWCGHLFGTNANHDNGFMQMYAPYGQGIIIYAGFDHDDSGNSGYQRVRQLEFALPVPVSVPCTQSVALAFLIQPNQEASFTSGTAATLHASMETLANLGWAGHVTISTTGDFPATVTPSGFDMNGGTQPLAVSVNVPASAKPGAYTVNVVGTGNDGKTAQASITITGTAPLKKAVLKKHQRIRIYGIHFDVDSAHIQPRSEPVIAQIAALMKENPTWKFEISGHTDSDGGAAYNLGLSQRRAQSVVNDLVTRYHIARSRMVPKGYGLSRPVATNSTAAGKALNRRVELERLQ